VFRRTPRASTLVDHGSPAWPFTRVTIRTALLLGFGLTLGIWLFTGYYFTQRIREGDERAAAINSRYRRAQALLSTVRAQVLLESVYVRDALLDPDPAATGAYRRRLEDTYNTVDRALARYEPVLDSSTERERVAELRHEIESFHDAMLQVLATGVSRSSLDARNILNSQVVPKREIAIRVSDEVQALNRDAFVQQQNDIVANYGATQKRVWEGLGVALAASFGIGLFATIYATRLEHRVRLQQIKDAQNAHDLQQLSAKLITAQEEERRSIARELHDEVGQVLTAIKVELAVAQRAVVASGGSKDLLDDARAIAEGAITTVRDLSHLLHPALLDDLGLGAAVEWYLRGFGKRHDVRVELLQDRMDERLTPEIEAAAYRIIQEALTNVAKHARATVCRVYLQRLQQTLLITIEDDGTGFDEAKADRRRTERGLGLVNIRERVGQLRGTIRLETAPGKGTRLTAELPARPRVVPRGHEVQSGAAAAQAPATPPPGPTAVVRPV
jgi:signal transduction histidine kinase